jgi:hypothetical protein
MSIKLLHGILGSQARALVLRHFLVDPGRAYYQRQVSEATGVPLRAVQRELERLTEAGLLYRRDEGNRAYYQADSTCLIFEDLRNMVLKTADFPDQLRGALADDEAVRLAFMIPEDRQVLLVTSGRGRPALPARADAEYTVVTSEEFLSRLDKERDTVSPFLSEGIDLLGRREDAIWRHIADAGFDVQRGKGVA